MPLEDFLTLSLMGYWNPWVPTARKLSVPKIPRPPLPRATKSESGAPRAFNFFKMTVATNA